MYLTNPLVEFIKATDPFKNFTMLDPFRKTSLYSGLIALSYSEASAGRGG